MILSENEFNRGEFASREVRYGHKYQYLSTETDLMRRRQPRGEVLIVIPMVMLIALVFEEGARKEGRGQKSHLRSRDLLLKSLTLDGELDLSTGRLSALSYNS